MTITGTERLINWFYDSNAAYWKAFDNDRAGNSRKMVGSNFDVKDSTPDDAVRRLRSFLELYSVNGGRFYIWAVENTNNTKGGFYTWFELSPLENTTPNNGIGALPQGYVKADDISEHIERALTKYKQEETIKRLEAELAEAKALINDSATERVLTRVEPYVPAIIAGMFPGSKPIHIAGTETTANKENSISDPETSMRNSLEFLAEKYNNLPEILEKLATKAKEDPEMLDTALTML